MHAHAVSETMDQLASLEITNKPTTLTDLPTELLVDIAELSDAVDLPSLRFTCRQLRDAVDDTFIKAFFTKRVHSCTKKSLQALCDITAHPQLITKLESVAIVINDVCEHHHPDFDDPFIRSPWQDYRESELGLRLAKERYDAQQKILRESGLDVSLLTEAFENLSSANRQVSITLARSFSPVAILGYNEEQVERLRKAPTQFSDVDFNDRTDRSVDGHSDHLARTFFSTLCASRFPVTELQSFSIRPFAFNLSLQGPLRGLPGRLGSLRVLDLQLNYSYPHNGFHPDHYRGLDGIFRFLSGLEVLRLSNTNPERFEELT
jgi:hypothetical protein